MARSRTEPQEAIKLTVYDDEYNEVGHVDLANVCGECDGWGKHVDVGFETFKPCVAHCTDGLVLDLMSGHPILQLMRHFGQEGDAS